MLLNQKEDVHHTIRLIGRSPGVVGIRIYDKRGTIIFSSAEEEIGKRVNLKAEGCVNCHDAERPLQSLPAGSRVRVYRGVSGEGILGMINPIENEPVCSQAACHAHPPSKTVLGVLDVRFSMAYADRSQDQARSYTVAATLSMALLVGVVSAGFIFRMVRVPVKRLIDGTRRVALGDLGSKIQLEGKGEVSALASAFNTMTDNLRQAHDEIQEWSQRLEEKVVKKAEELSRAQRQIVLMEKMSSLGKLAATVAHELNNPIAGILNYAKLVDREVATAEIPAETREELGKYLGMIQKESIRCGAIVRNLLLFTRRTGAEFKQSRANEIVERALMLVNHHLEMSRVQLERRPMPEDDQILCDPDQLQQALVALFVNAVEAMPQGGTLRLEVRPVGEHLLEIDVSDTGVGIPPEALPHVFEPFFTSKESATGVGLGLAVVYGIVERHCGTIEVSSEVGRGTCFKLLIPRRPAPTPTPAKAAAAGGGGVT
jgi:two-component system NtrC family sensor kinase